MNEDVKSENQSLTHDIYVHFPTISFVMAIPVSMVTILKPFWHKYRDPHERRLPCRAASDSVVSPFIFKGSVQRDGFSSCTGLLLGGDIRIRLDGIPDAYILTDKHLGKQHVVDALVSQVFCYLKTLTD